MTGTFIYVIDNSKISGNYCGSLRGCYHLTCISKVLPMWFYKGSGDISNVEIVSEVDNFDYVLTIRKMQVSNTGFYECAAQNQYGDKYFAKIHVQIGSKFIR